MSVLILAEKPNQAKAYAEAFPKVEKRDGHFYIPPCSSLPSGGNITWAYGHLVELKSPQDYKTEWDLSQLPMLPSHYEYKVSADKKKQFNLVKKLMKEAEIMQISTDIER